MKILMVTNLYPPRYLGGYEVHCAQIAEALQAAGHQVRVLTSSYGLPLTLFGAIQRRDDEVNGVSVHRRLHEYYFEPQPWIQRPWRIVRAMRELRDCAEFKRIVDEFRPDIINWWNLNGLTKTMLPLANRWRIPDVHAVDDVWLINDYGVAGEEASAFWKILWEGEWGPPVLHPALRWIGAKWERRTKARGIPTRDLSHRPSCVCFLSEFLRRIHQEKGLDFPSTQVIYGGVHVGRFFEPLPKARGEGMPIRLLYAGQVTPDRGLQTIVEAFGSLPSAEREKMALTVVGTGPVDYMKRVKAQVEKMGLAGRIVWLGKVPHQRMPDIYKSHDLFIFSSKRPEGLGFVSIEAMFAGCAVVTTGSGGSMEIARAANLPLFPKDDSEALTRLLTRLATDRQELLAVASRGQEAAIRMFSFERMIEEWMRVLEDLGRGKQSDGDSARIGRSTADRLSSCAHSGLT